MAEFDKSQPPPTLNEFQADFQPTSADIDAIHGQPRSNEEKKVDETAIRSMETDGLPKHWSSPWFECKDLSRYLVSNPRVDFPRIARQYENILEVWQNNYQYGKKIQQNPQLRLPPFARLDQACNGDLEASNARRRKHLIGTIAYCWQLRKLCQDEKDWLKQQANKRKVITAKKEKKNKEKKKESKKDQKNKPKTKTEKKEEIKEEEPEEEPIVEEINPYLWGNTSPTKMYNEMAKALVGVYFLCLCGFVPLDEIQSDLYYQKKYDAAHVFANHMAKLVSLTTADSKPLFQVILNMVCTGGTSKNFIFTHHLHNCINFESKHSSQSLHEQASQLQSTLTDLPPTSSKRLTKLAQLTAIEKELNTCATLNDQYIQMMKKKAIQNRTDRSTKRVRAYPDYVYLRVFHELGLQVEAIGFLQSWGITEEDYNKVWRKIDNGELDNNLRRIICGAVSDKSKKQTAMDIDHHKLGIGPDYIKKKYSDLLAIYNERVRKETQAGDNETANILENNTNFLNHFGSVPDGGNNTTNDGNRLNLKEDEINTTMFAHKYLSGQITIPDDDDDMDNEMKNIAQNEQKLEEKNIEMKSELMEEKKSELIITDDVSVAKVDREEKLDNLPKNNAKLQQLLRRKERLLMTMSKKYGMSDAEIKKMLELTDGRAVALSPEEFYNFYSRQPREVVNKFMDSNLKSSDREQMGVYLRTMVDSYRRIQLEKMKLRDPAKHFGSLRSAVNAYHQQAIERIDYTKKKYTDEYFQNVQRECEEFEKKLHVKKQHERQDRHKRLEAIKKLERKKRERLTTPINFGMSRSVSGEDNKAESEQLKLLKEDAQVLMDNEKVIRDNIAIKENNEYILDAFFDNEEAKLAQLATDEAKEERLRGVDDSGKNLEMQGFLHRESAKNFGKIIAAKTDVTPITEQVIQRKMERERKRTESRHLQFTQQELLSATASPRLGAANASAPSGAADASSSSLYMQSQNERLQKLLSSVANSNQKEISADMRSDARSLLSPMNIGYRSGFKSKSPSPMLAIGGDDHTNHSGDEQGTDIAHGRSSSVVVHDMVLDSEVLNAITEESDADMLSPHSRNDADHDEYYEESKETMDRPHDETDPFKLPFKDIDIMETDLSWLDTDELVPISHKDMLDANDISRLKVKDMPEMDVIRNDGLEQRERQSAVDKLEKSYMADAALKKAKDKEKEEMTKRLEEQKQAILEAELKREQQEFDILKQGHVIRQKKSSEELAAELAALTPEQREERRKQRKERNKYMANNRNPQLLQELDRGVEEETVMVEVEVDEFDMIPIEETEVGKELADSVRLVREMEQKFDMIASSDDDMAMAMLNNKNRNGPAVDKRQQMIFDMSTKQMYGYVMEKTGMSEEVASKILEHGLNGQMIEIAIMDGELDDIIVDMGFDYTAMGALKKCLQFDGWKMKQMYPVSMSGDMFVGWLGKCMGQKMCEAVINNGIDGRTIAVCIEEDGGGLGELMRDCGDFDEKEIESLRSQFVMDSQMITYWGIYDVSRWLKSKLKSVKSIDDVIRILAKNGVDGCRLLSVLGKVPSDELSAFGIEQAVQSKILGKMHQICRNILTMDHIEIMYWIHANASVLMECNGIIAQVLYENKITGNKLANQSDLKSFLKKKLKGKKVKDSVIDTLVGMLAQVVIEQGGFIPNYMIQDPNIMDFNENTSQGKGGKKMFASEQERIEYEQAKDAKKKRKIQEKKAAMNVAKKRHSRVQSKIELGQSYVIQDGKKFMRVYKGKKKVNQPQKIKNYSKKTITLEKARNAEQAKIRMARKQKYEKRRREKAAIHSQVSNVISQQLEHGIQEANEMIGIHEDDSDDQFLTDSEEDYTDSEDELERNLMMTHRSQLSTSRIAERLEFVGDAAGPAPDNSSSNLSVPGKKGAGRVTMAGHALEDFIGGTDRTLFHKRRASSIVQRIVAKSQNDLQNFKMRRGSKSRLSRRSLSQSGLGGAGRHSRGFSSGHFVTQFFKSASDRQKIEAGMRGEAPLIVYYCDVDEERPQELTDIYQTSVLDTYIDDYSTFDDYIKILSMRLEQAQKKHRMEMDELRRNKEDLTNEVSALSTKKEELIRLIGQERSLFKRELPQLAHAKAEKSFAQDNYDSAEVVIRDKFNETKLHVMMMMQFRDNHLRKLDGEKLKSSNLQQNIQILQSDIEELLSHYFTLQNAHNKLEHTVALLSELTTLCHEVNVRKKSEYEREICDLLAMIERYRCRIRNVDRLISDYEKEVVELRMKHEKRSAEFKKIQKNPTTNRTAATIDYYVAQRKLYEEKIASQDNTFDDFVSVTQRYTKELSSKNTALSHYEKRSELADLKFKAAVQRKNVIYKECRDLCKSLNISWKQAEKEYIERGHELAQQFNDQYNNMVQFEQDQKPYGYEFIDSNVNVMHSDNSKNEIIHSFDEILTDKTHDQLLKEEEYIETGQLDRLTTVQQDDIDLPKVQQQIVDGKFNTIESQKTFQISANNNSADGNYTKQMSILHRGDKHHQLDTYRAPGIRNMDEHPDNALLHTFDSVNQSFVDKYGKQAANLVNIDNSYINEGPNSNSDNDNDDISPPPSDHEHEHEHGLLEKQLTSRSVHFQSDDKLEKTTPKTPNIDQ